MRTRRTILVVFGALLVLAGAATGAAAGTMALVHATQQDSDGFYSSPTERFETSTSVLVGHGELQGSEWAREQLVGAIRIRATAADQGPLFVGIGPRDQVEAWLDGAAYDEVVSVGYFPFQDKTERVPGSRAVAPPGEQDFWAASVSGTGTQTLTWVAENGRWSLVVMNADASPGVAVDASAGAEAEALLPAAIVLGAAALLLLAGGVVIMLLGVRAWHAAGEAGDGTGAPQAGAPAAAVQGTVPPAEPGTPTAYPVRLDARLDVPLSRWLWLVKWFLAIPHLVVLFFLWLAVAPLTVLAGIAILFTGHYPRALFDFNVGVFRWTWRVSYYAFHVLGTDRYPPFSLDPDPEYPADLAVDHPERLSRGLVLVKWWLLAIPHYLVVSLFAGGWAGWFGWSGDGWRVDTGLGVIGILVLVAMMLLLFTGRYPQPVYDFVLGMNRWCYRVLVYALLMRDEYPPFRLDNGGVDPGSRPAPAPPAPPPDRGGQLVGSTRSA